MGSEFCYKASAPGSLMLMGEHAVLRGKMALVCALNQFVHVTLTPRHDRMISIASPRLGKLKVSLDDLQIMAPFTFVSAAILHVKVLFGGALKQGFDLLIETDFSEQMGFGSSAAVTVASLAVLHLWLSDSAQDLPQLLLGAQRVIRQVQGFGSAADAAASICGGVVLYRTEDETPLLMQKIAPFVPLTVVYSGKKVRTQEVVQQVMRRYEKNERIFRLLDEVVEGCVEEAVMAIKECNWLRLGELANIHQGLQDAMGVNTSILSNLIFALRGAKKKETENVCDRNIYDSGIYGAKISGSGMGDCVIGIGEFKRSVTLSDNDQKFLGVIEASVKVNDTGLVLIKRGL